MGRYADRDLRNLLIFRQDGKCALCGGALGPEFEVDHIIPWAAGGPTILSNLEALCLKCHRIKTRSCHGSARPKS
jgi:5-methylcytosine-specific restriction endonuclease McrA